MRELPFFELYSVKNLFAAVGGIGVLLILSSLLVIEGTIVVAVLDGIGRIVRATGVIGVCGIRRIRRIHRIAGIACVALILVAHVIVCVFVVLLVHDQSPHNTF